MTAQHRITLTLTTLLAAMFALLAIAAAVGSSGGSTGNSGGSGGTSGLLPWHQAKPAPVYAKVVYHPHQMCDELRHKATKSPAVNP
jgi:hypothetical protein